MKTVYVIGAGASAEVGLPVGESLKKRISTFLNFKFETDMSSTLKNGNSTIYDAIKLHAKENTEKSNIIRAARVISDSLPLAISIDNFIDTHRGNEPIAFCGKLAIVYSILEAERHSELYFDEYKGNAKIKFDRISETWYVAFFKTLTENCSIDDLSERLKDITLIIFNYDRCVEHFLYNAFKVYYNCSDSEAAQLLKFINIYHPYGSVGTLPCLDKSNTSIQFGANIKPHRLIKLVQKIKTFTEGTDPESSEINEIKKRMAELEKIVFLGFAFHKLNIKLIIQTNKRDSVRSALCFATTYGFSEHDTDIIEGKIVPLLSSSEGRSYISEIKTAPLTCGNLFKEFSQSLSFN